MKLPFVKKFFILFLVIISCNLAFAQTSDVELNLPEKPQKKYNLTFRLDYSMKELDFKNTFRYEGEYLKNIWEEHIWQAYDSTIINYNDVSRTSNFKFDLMISVIEPLNIGLSYHILNKQTKIVTGSSSTPTSTSISRRIEFYPFFALAGIVDYKIPIKPVKRLYVNPSLSFGTYQGNDLFTGVGKEWYTDIKLAVLYNIGNKFGIRVFADYNNWLYREKSTSIPFPDKNRIVKSNVSTLNFGAGLSYRFFLIPD